MSLEVADNDAQQPMASMDESPSPSPSLDDDESKKRKRGSDDEEKEQDVGIHEKPDEEPDASNAPIITQDGNIEFSLSAIHKHLICGLCSGYYKDPYTITDCLHTFCKSCLYYAVACGCFECPDCNGYLGTDPSKVAVLDHSMQDVSEIETNYVFGSSQWCSKLLF